MKSLFVGAYLVGLLGSAIQRYLPSYLEFFSDENPNKYLFAGRIEYIYQLGLHRNTLRLLSYLPFVAPHVRGDLRADLARGYRETNSTISEYDPAKHDTAYRRLLSAVLTNEECAIMRNLADRNIDNMNRVRDDFGESVESSLNQEFEAVSVFKLLGMEHDGSSSDDEEDDLDDSYFGDADVTDEEHKLLLSILGRVQLAVEETFDTDTALLDFPDLSRRSNPAMESSGLLGFYKRWQYLSSGGHGLHADRCTYASEDLFLEGFTCRQTVKACCPHRVYSVLLYLNDDEQGLEGGELVAVDRQDIDKNETQAIFHSDVGLAEHLRHTLTVKPQCGKLMLFASDTRVIHGTLPIKKGRRYAMPMWFSDLDRLQREDKLLNTLLDQVWVRCTSGDYGAIGKRLPLPSYFKEYIQEDGFVEEDDCKELLIEMDELAYEGINGGQN